MSNDNIKKLLTFDPGATVTGWAYSEFDLSTGILLVKKYGFYKPSAEVRKVAYREEQEFVEAPVLTTEFLQTMTRNKILTHMPDGVGVEDAFYHPKFPRAYPSLVLCIHALAMTLFNMFRDGEIPIEMTSLYKFPPKVIKKEVTGLSNCSKQQMINTVTNHPYIVFETPPKELLQDHEADAIGAAYTLSKHLYPGSIVEVDLQEIVNDKKPKKKAKKKKKKSKKTKKKAA